MPEKDKQPNPQQILDNLRLNTKLTKDIKRREDRRIAIDILEFLNTFSKPTISDQDRKVLIPMYKTYSDIAPDVFTMKEYENIESILEPIRSYLFSEE